MTSLSAVPYVRLSGFYFAYFATVGALVPYFNLYLQALAFTPAQIGQATAMLVAGRIVAPALWGWMADRTGRRLRVVRSTLALSVLAFAPVLAARDFVPMALVLLLYGLFWSASLPQFEAITLNHLGARVEAYSKVRLWGSIGFIITASFLGALLQHVGINWLPAILLLLIISVWASSLCTPEGTTAGGGAVRPSLRRVLLQPSVLALFGTLLLMQLSYGPYYAFYTIFLEQHGYTRTTIGLLWSLGVVAEIALFLVMHRLLPAWGLRRLMLASLAAGVVRWMMIGQGVQSMWMLILAQLLHAATFGMHHAAAVQYVHQHFTGPLQGRGQALYSSIAYGLGGALGAYATGYLWSHLGPARTYAVAATLCALAWGIAWRGLRETAREHS
ncbi:MAG: MFS transporter [Chromatiales bacterium]